MRTQSLAIAMMSAIALTACGSGSSNQPSDDPPATVAPSPATQASGTTGPPPPPAAAPAHSLISGLAERLSEAGYTIKHYPQIDSDFSAVVRAGELQVWAYSKLREAVRVTRQYNDPKQTDLSAIYVRRVGKHVYMLLRPGTKITAAQRADFYRTLRAGEGPNAKPTNR